LTGGPATDKEHRYATLAQELGLEVTSVKPIGWSATTVPTQTADAYASQVEVLAELTAALITVGVAPSRPAQPDRAGPATPWPAPAPAGDGSGWLGRC
jgi:hypothetical protein